MTAPAIQQEERPCPKCGGRTWDNRVGKKNPKAPDFKCRDRSCDGVIWPPKYGDRQAAAPAPRGPQPHSIGTLPIDEPDPIRKQLVQMDGWAELREKYAECLTFVVDNVVPVLNRTEVGTDPQAVAAVVATLFIARRDAGV